MKEEEIRGVCLDMMALHFDERMDDFKEEGCGAGPIESPIERMLYAALVTLGKLENLGETEPENNGDFVIVHGLHISPQYKIGKYRVDFLVSYGIDIFSIPKEKTIFSVGQELVVECDGTEWHERTEKERRYEKERDRFIQTEGYKIFRYTGKEITDAPFKVASEIFTYVVGQKPNSV